MEIKKSSKADLENKKSLFLEIGLCVSIGLMILLFSLSQGEKVIKDMAVEDTYVQMENVEVTRQPDNAPSVPTPAQALQVVSETIRIVDNDTKIETDMVFADFDESLAFNDNPTSSEEIIGTGEEAFYQVEDMPTFQGGDIQKFSNWVMRRIQYPPIAQSMGIQGMVTLTFVIEKDGSLTNIEVISSADTMLEKEATRVVSSSPKWEPGRQRDVPVRVRFNIPIVFKLES